MTTDELTNQLKDYSDIDQYMSENKTEFDENAFKSFIENLLEKKGLNKSKLSDKSGVSPPYIYGLFNGNKDCPRKDILIKLAFGLELTLEETNRLLKLGGVSELRSKIRRESIIMFSLLRGLDISETDDILSRHNEKTLRDKEKG